MAKKPVEPPKPKLHVDFDVRTYTIREPEESDDRWAHRGDYGASVHLRGISMKERSYSRHNDSCEVSFEPKEGEMVYVVYCIYTTGSTFGTTGGYTAVAGIFKKGETAIAARQRILDHYKHFHGGGWRAPQAKPNSNFKSEWSLDLKDDDGKPYEVHVSWYDFFGGLDECEIGTAMVTNI
jgi:hypothetical protein